MSKHSILYKHTSLLVLQWGMFPCMLFYTLLLIVHNLLGSPMVIDPVASHGSAYEGMHFQMCSETGYFLTLLVIAATNRMRPLKCPACRGGAKKNPICLLLNKKDTSFSPVHTTCPNKCYLLFKDCQTDSW